MRIPFVFTFLLVSLLSLQGCNSKSSVPASVSVDTVVPTRHAFTVDSMESLRYDQMMYLADSTLDKSQSTPLLKALLSKPVDLVSFKKRHGGPNSGGIRDASPLYRPKGEGLYLHYFAFPHFREHGLSAVVYRSGKTIGDYYEDRDQLVCLFSAMPDPELGEANFIRKTIDEIEAALGGAHLRNGAFLYYADDQQHLLTLCVGKGNTVLWWKWMWLSYNVKAYKDIPHEARNSEGW